MEPVISAEELAAGYRGKPLVKGLTLSIDPGEVLAILGPNGAGKTTLLKTLAGIRQPLSGRVLIAGNDTRTTPRRLLAHIAAYVPQSPSPGPKITALEYIILALLAPGHGLRVKEEHLAAAEEALEKLGASHLADKPLAELSGGERQLVEIARAIAPRPKALLLDEPTSMLDASHAAKVARAIARLADEEEVAVAVITHDPNLAIDLADTVLLIARGRHLYGPADELLEPSVLAPLYGARLHRVIVDDTPRIVPAPLARRKNRPKRLHRPAACREDAAPPPVRAQPVTSQPE